MAKRRRALQISADDALRAVHVLLHDGKILARDVTRAIERREKLVRQLRAKLVELGDEGARVAGRLRRQAAPKVAAAGRSIDKALGVARRRGKKVISQARQAAYRAQGRYMAAVRTLPKTARVRIKKIRQSSGVDAAIRAAKKMAASR
jgi:hypothetical protein